MRILGLKSIRNNWKVLQIQTVRWPQLFEPLIRMQSHSHSDLSNEWNFFTFLMGFFNHLCLIISSMKLFEPTAPFFLFNPLFFTLGVSSPLSRPTYSAIFSTTCCQPTLRSPKCAWSAHTSWNLAPLPPRGFPLLGIDEVQANGFTSITESTASTSCCAPKSQKRGIKGPENTETPKNWRCTTINRAVKEFLEAGSFTSRARGSVFFKGRKGKSLSPKNLMDKENPEKFVKLWRFFHFFLLLFHYSKRKIQFETFFSRYLQEGTTKQKEIRKREKKKKKKKKK